MSKVGLWGAAAIALALSAGGAAAERSTSRKAESSVGTTVARPPVPFDPQAMNAMLRADRDKDGTLTREELDQYDLSMGRRFREADVDGDGKLTLYEFERLLGPPETSAAR